MPCCFSVCISFVNNKFMTVFGGVLCHTYIWYMTFICIYMLYVYGTCARQQMEHKWITTRGEVGVGQMVKRFSGRVRAIIISIEYIQYIYI